VTETIGILFVTLGILGGGLSYAVSVKEEVHRAEGFLRLARLIRSRIACFRQPLVSIYADFSDEALDKCGFTEELRRGEFLLAVAKKKDVLGLRPAFMTLLTDFGQTLGKSGAEDQLRHCDRCIAEMEAMLSAMKSTCPERLRLARALSLCFAAMAALLLL
jgi:hypothetical protein